MIKFDFPIFYIKNYHEPKRYLNVCRMLKSNLLFRTKSYKTYLDFFFYKLLNRK